MIPVLLIAIPLVAGIVGFFIKQAKPWALFASVVTLGVMLYAVAGNHCSCIYDFKRPWIPELGADFHVTLTGIAKILCLLTAVAFPLIFLATYNKNRENESSFYSLMLLSQAGLMGVFVAADALLFYFFWELALIPVYFLASRWGGEKRIAATFKFFIYTFVGSILMLVGIIYLFQQTPNNSFSIESFYSLQLSVKEQYWLFALFFIAFAIKMPIFPFHTWQPDAYEQSPTPVTMVMSGIMVKMGLFGIIQWLVPIMPIAAIDASLAIIVFSVIGIIYASLIAMRQDDLKRLVAYSSIAHIGLMCAALFTREKIGYEGVIIQMFSHGINIIGLWMVIDMIESRTGIRKMSQLGGLAQRSPWLATALVIIALANIALPLTNAFVGEFLMFNALFRYNVWVAAFAGLGIILAAVYTLNMIQKVFFGEIRNEQAQTGSITWNEKTALAVIILLILVFGVYPAPLFQLY